MDPRISKAFGVEMILSRRGFTMENLCSFGDADNDYDMALHAGVEVFIEKNLICQIRKLKLLVPLQVCMLNVVEFQFLQFF